MRHLIAPSDAPGWGQYAFGRVGLEPGHPLELHTVSIADPYNVEDLTLLTAGTASGSASVASDTYELLNAYIAGVVDAG